jgi:hypothetical protein
MKVDETLGGWMTTRASAYVIADSPARAYF